MKIKDWFGRRIPIFCITQSSAISKVGKESVFHFVIVTFFLNFQFNAILCLIREAVLKKLAMILLALSSENAMDFCEGCGTPTPVDPDRDQVICLSCYFSLVRHSLS